MLPAWQRPAAAPSGNMQLFQLEPTVAPVGRERVYSLLTFVVTLPKRPGRGHRDCEALRVLVQGPLLPLLVAAAVGQVQALALLGLAHLALLGIVRPAVCTGSGVASEPGPAAGLTSGGTTSGARSAILGSKRFAAWAAGLTPIQSKTLPLRSRPSAQPPSRQRRSHRGAGEPACKSCPRVTTSVAPFAFEPRGLSPERLSLPVVIGPLRHHCDSA